MSLKRNAQQLKSFRLFAGLSNAALESLAGRMNWKSYEKGQMIVRHEDGTNDVYFLLTGKGSVRIYSSNGKVAEFRELKRGDIFGEFAAIDEGPRSASVEAKAKSSAAVIGAESFRQLLAEEPTVSLALMKHFVHEIRDLTNRISLYSTKLVNERIEAELLQMGRDAGPASPDQPNQAWIAALPPRAEWALRMSTHREAIPRHLGYLENVLGLIERRGRGRLIKDMARLAARVEGADE